MPHEDRSARRRAEGRWLRRNRFRPAVIGLEPRRLLSAYIVNDPSDLPLDSAKGPGETVNGTITLRSAIQQVDVDGSGSIGFASSMTITTSGLPVVTAKDVTISGQHLVLLQGNGDGASGLVFAGDDAVVTGLAIAGFGGDGIDVGATGATIGGTAAGAGNVIFGNGGTGISLGSFGGSALVQGNFIGTDVNGDGGIGNEGNGIFIGSANNTIGGASAAARNVISGNAVNGVYIDGAGATGNVVAGDLIGVNAAGNAAIPNYEGVKIDSGATDNLIGASGDGADDSAERDVISGNTFDGVRIVGTGTDGNVVAGDFIGTDITGTAAVGNDDVLQSDEGGGVEIGNGASDNLIGTSGHSKDDAGQRNIISGNWDGGVAIYLGGAGDNVVAGNYIGTNATGTAALENTFVGIWLLDLTSPNYVGVNSLYGAPSADQQNVISGNVDAGVDINNTDGSVVAGNLIGTNATGTAAIPNSPYSGIYITRGSQDNLVGSLGNDGASIDALERNVISGNSLDGVEISGAGTTGNVVAGNYIGLKESGTSALGNGSAGVVFESGATNNTVGGTSSGTANIIAFNGGVGVQVGFNALDASLDNAILGNSIFANNGLGINIDNTAPEPAPILGFALSGATLTSITGTVTGAENATLRLEFFSNPAGTNQGETYLGFAVVTTNGSGAGSFTFSPSSVVTVGLDITATATDSNGNTSEFAAPQPVQAAPVNITGDVKVRTGGLTYNRATHEFTQTLSITNTSSAPIPGPIELELVNLKNGVLVNESGTYQGNPYITLMPSGSLGIGQSLSITLIFTDPTLAAISYTPEILAGPIPPENDNS